MRVTDDGRGGAALTPGGGLAGVGERLAALDGGIEVDSPPGGPTTVLVHLPWRS
jgi:signal transduction histidine kinase